MAGACVDGSLGYAVVVGAGAGNTNIDDLLARFQTRRLTTSR